MNDWFVLIVCYLVYFTTNLVIFAWYRIVKYQKHKYLVFFTLNNKIVPFIYLP